MKNILAFISKSMFFYVPLDPLNASLLNKSNFFHKRKKNIYIYIASFLEHQNFLYSILRNTKFDNEWSYLSLYLVMVCCQVFPFFCPSLRKIMVTITFISRPQVMFLFLPLTSQLLQVKLCVTLIMRPKDCSVWIRLSWMSQYGSSVYTILWWKHFVL